MKKNLVGLLCFLVVLSGCSKKDPLPGTREELVVSEASERTVREQQMDTTPVQMDGEVENSECPQAFYNSTHSYAPLKISDDAGAEYTSEAHLLWQSKLDFDVTKSLRTASAPVVANGKVFCSDAAGIIYALDEKTGKRIWRASSTILGKDGQIGTGMAYVGGTLLVTTSFAECLAFDDETGKILWRIKLSAPSKGDGITIYNDKAFILCANGKLQVVDIKSGRILWEHSGLGAETTFFGCSAPAVCDGVVYVAYPSGEVFALSAENGSVLWSSMLSKFSLTNSAYTLTHPRACPVVWHGVVYVASGNSQTVAFDAKDGKILWSCDYGSVQTPIVRGNSIFVLNEQGELVHLNNTNGKVRWISDKLDKDGVWCGEILLKNHMAMLTPDGFLKVVSLNNGKVDRIVKIDSGRGGILLNPVVARRVIFIQTNGGNVLAYKLVNKKLNQK